MLDKDFELYYYSDTEMQNVKEFILKNLITICCVASVILLLLPFCKVTDTASAYYVEESDTTTFTGFDVVLGDAGSLFGWLLIICPAVLVAMNYIEALNKYKSVLAIVLPIVSIVAQIAAFAACKKAFLAATGGQENIDLGFGVGMSIKTAPAIGFYLLIIAFIATFIAGAMTYHGLTLDKKGITEFGSKIVDAGKSGLESAKELGTKVSEKREAAKAEASPVEAPAEAPAAKPEKAGMNTADTLALLENLSKMKESGILTEEEFNAKKQELLKNI